MESAQFVEAIFVLPLSVGVSTLPEGEAGVLYAGSLRLSGGLPPYAVSILPLPTGLSVNSEGLVTGTPERSGRPRLSVQVTDSLLSP
jgi:hypothetical protein